MNGCVSQESLHRDLVNTVIWFVPKSGWKTDLHGLTCLITGFPLAPRSDWEIQAMLDRQMKWRQLVHFYQSANKWEWWWELGARVMNARLTPLLLCTGWGLLQLCRTQIPNLTCLPTALSFCTAVNCTHHRMRAGNWNNVWVGHVPQGTGADLFYCHAALSPVTWHCPWDGGWMCSTASVAPCSSSRLRAHVTPNLELLRLLSLCLTGNIPLWETFWMFQGTVVTCCNWNGEIVARATFPKCECFEALILT